MAKKEKTGGRIVGTPNKGTTVIRQKIKDFLDSEIENIFEDIKTLPPKEKAQVFVKLLEYIIPRQTHSNINATLNREEESQSPVTIFLLPDNGR